MVLAALLVDVKKPVSNIEAVGEEFPSMRM